MRIAGMAGVLLLTVLLVTVPARPSDAAEDRCLAKFGAHETCTSGGIDDGSVAVHATRTQGQPVNGGPTVTGPV